MKKPTVPYRFFADVSKPERKYYEEAMSKLTETGINHAACIEELQNEIEQLKEKLQAPKS